MCELRGRINLFPVQANILANFGWSSLFLAVRLQSYEIVTYPPYVRNKRVDNGTKILTPS